MNKNNADETGWIVFGAGIFLVVALGAFVVKVMQDNRAANALERLAEYAESRERIEILFGPGGRIMESRTKDLVLGSEKQVEVDGSCSRK